MTLEIVRTVRSSGFSFLLRIDRRGNYSNFKRHVFPMQSDSMTLKLWISSFKRQSKRKGSASSLEEGIPSRTVFTVSLLTNTHAVLPGMPGGPATGPPILLELWDSFKSSRHFRPIAATSLSLGSDCKGNEQTQKDRNNRQCASSSPSYPRGGGSLFDTDTACQPYGGESPNRLP